MKTKLTRSNCLHKILVVGFRDVCWGGVVLGGVVLGGDLFKLYSRASNGNDYSTLLFATTPAQ